MIRCSKQKTNYRKVTYRFWQTVRSGECSRRTMTKQSHSFAMLWGRFLLMMVGCRDIDGTSSTVTLQPPTATPAQTVTLQPATATQAFYLTLHQTSRLSSTLFIGTYFFLGYWAIRLYSSSTIRLLLLRMTFLIGNIMQNVCPPFNQITWDDFCILGAVHTLLIRCYLHCPASYWSILKDYYSRVYVRRNFLR